MSKGKILVVDDEIYIVHILDFSLGMEGYEVITALDGEQALERLAQVPYAVLLTDLRLAMMDFLAVVRPARERD